MAYSKKFRIKDLEDERSFLESELAIFSENIAYFESTKAKYDVQINSFNKHAKNADLKSEINLRSIRDDLSERVSRLYDLRDKKIDRVAKINDELKNLY